MTTFILPAAQPAHTTSPHPAGNGRAAAEAGAQFGQALSEFLDTDTQQHPLLEPDVDPDPGQGRQAEAGQWAPATLGRDLIPELADPADSQEPAVSAPTDDAVDAPDTQGQEPVVVPQAATAAGPVTHAGTAMPQPVPGEQPPTVQQPPAAAPAQTTSPAPVTAPQAAPAAAPAVLVEATGEATQPAQADTGQPAAAAAPQQAPGSAATWQPSATPTAQPVDGATSPAAATTVTAPAPPQPAPAPATPAPAPVAVPQQALPLAPQLTGPLYQLAQAGEGQHVMTVSVNPDNIGPVTVRAHITTSGVQIELYAPTDPGRDALRAIVTDLRRDLAGLIPHSTLTVSTSDTPPPAGSTTSNGQHTAGGWAGHSDNRPRPEHPQATSEPADRYRNTPGEPTVTSETQAGRLDVVA